MLWTVNPLAEICQDRVFEEALDAYAIPVVEPKNVVLDPP
jgi:hypothetical protein